MEIDTTRLYEFRRRGKDIILQYCTEEDAYVAYINTVKKITDGVTLPKF